jgi:hypothetical protein
MRAALDAFVSEHPLPVNNADTVSTP